MVGQTLYVIVGEARGRDYELRCGYIELLLK